MFISRDGGYYAAICGEFLGRSRCMDGEREGEREGASCRKYNDVDEEDID